MIAFIGKLSSEHWAIQTAIYFALAVAAAAAATAGDIVRRVRRRK